jgi:hypothetical protein
MFGEHQAATASGGRDLPRRLWRKLLTSSPLPVGAPMLVVGTQPLEVSRRLGELGFDVLALCTDPAAAMTARLQDPQTEYRWLANDEPDLPQQTFALALVLDDSGWAANLLSRQSRLFTARILAALQPGRRLVWRHEPEGDLGHQSGCRFRHLACFPGEVDVDSFSAPVWPLSLFQPVRRRETTLVELTIPSDPLAPLDWRRCVDKGLLTDRRSCCAAGVGVAADDRQKWAA